MARQTNGTNQSLNSASTLSLSSYTKLVVAFWLLWDSFGTDDDLALEYSANYNNDDAFIIDPNSSVSSQFDFILHGVTGDARNGGHITRPSAGAWHHYVVNFDRTTGTALGVAVWVDGTSVTVTQDNSQDLSSTTFANHILNLMSRNNASLFGDGQIAELSIWGGIQFAQGDVNTLYNGGAGADARTVQAGSQVYYWRICGTVTPEPYLIGGIDLTVNGATESIHPISGCGAGTAAPIPSGPVQSGLRW